MRRELEVDPVALECLMEQRKAFHILRQVATDANNSAALDILAADASDHYLGTVFRESSIAVDLARRIDPDLAGDAPMDPTISFEVDIDAGSDAHGAAIAATAVRGTLLSAHTNLSILYNTVLRCPSIHKTPVAVVRPPNYFEFVSFVLAVCQYVQTTVTWPASRGDDAACTDDPVTQDELKLVINTLGPNHVHIHDVNRDGRTDVSVFTNRVWTVCLVMFFAQVAYVFIYVALPFLFLNSFAATAAQTTLLQVVFSLGQLFGCPALFRASEFIGRKYVYLLITLFYGATCIMLAQANIFWFSRMFGGSVIRAKQSVMAYVYVVRFVQGVFGLVAPMGFLIAGDLVPPAQRPVTYTMLNIVTIVAALVALLVSSFVFPNIKNFMGEGYVDDSLMRYYVTFRNIMYVTAGCYFVAAVLVVFVLPESSDAVLARRSAKRYGLSGRTAISAKARADSLREVILYMLRSRNLVLLFVGYVLNLGTTAAKGTTDSIIVSKYLNLTNASEGQVFYAFNDLISVIVAAVLAVFLSKAIITAVGEINVSIISGLFTLVTFLGRDVPVPVLRPWFTTMSAINAFANVFVDAPLISIASMYASPTDKGTLLGIFQIGNSLARLLLALFAGYLYTWQWRNANALCCLFTLAGISFLAFVAEPRKPPSTKDPKAKRACIFF